MPDHVSGLLSPSTSWILVFAHPGHELRAHRVMEVVRPAVMVLTDGAGSTAEPRLDDSLALLARAGARRAATFGALTDRAAYAALLASNPQPFVACVDLLADTLISESVQAVLIDAAEGYNPVHDVCHWIGRAATTRARTFGARIDLFEVDLVSHPDSSGDGLRVVLDDKAFARKLEAISRYDSLKGEAEAAFERYGRDSFRVEFLRRVVEGPVPPPSWIPYYEKVGEERVRSGRYTSVLRYGAHVKPVIETILTSACESRDATDFRPLHE
jgi:hypothetical protein